MQFAPVTSDGFALAGGLDQVSPPLALKPGFVRDALNWECHVNGGYTSIKGYERFDGQDRPSEAAYTVLPASITAAVSIGDTLTGATSSATATIAAIGEDNSYFVLTKVSGDYQDGETLTVSAATVATATDDPVELGASTERLNAQYLNAAADIYRADITAVPGSGDVLGVFAYSDVVYAFRANVGATAVNLYKSTTSGWAQVNYYYELAFTAGGTSEYEEGDTVSQGGVTATVKRVVLTSGSWASSNAAGRLIITAPSGGNFAAGAIAGGGAATASGAQTAITFATGGRFETVQHNFGGAVNQRRVYGCDGANRAWEFDGDVLVPISTGMAVDTPSFIAVHKKHLFLGFGASLQHSGIGAPYVFTVVTGASELAMGDTITGLLSMAGNETTGALLITTRNGLYILYGSSSADWNLGEYSLEAGAYAYTLQQITIALMLDDIGVTSLATSANYGNFAHSALSARVKTFINERKGRAQASCTVRDKNQYRLFFNDRYALYITMAGAKVLGMMPVLLNDEVTCIWSGEFSDGTERIFFGSSDGVVYEMDAGTSFDGDDIETTLVTAFHHSGSPRQNKRYRYASLEASGTGYAEFEFTYELGYQDEDIPTPDVVTSVGSPSSDAWDQGTWDSGYWDGRSLLPTEFRLDGTAVNIAYRIRQRSDFCSPLTLSSVMTSYSQRRMRR